MEKEEIIHSIKKAISKIVELDESEVSESDNFKDNLGIDELDILEILMELEDEFDIEINDDDDAIRESTIENLANIIKKEVG